MMLLYNFIQSAIQKKKKKKKKNEKEKKKTDVMKEKLNPLVEEYRVLSIFYITNFCETRKIYSNKIRVFFLLLNFLKSRKCALN